MKSSYKLSTLRCCKVLDSHEICNVEYTITAANSGSGLQKDLTTGIDYTQLKLHKLSCKGADQKVCIRTHSKQMQKRWFVRCTKYGLSDAQTMTPFSTEHSCQTLRERHEGAMGHWACAWLPSKEYGSKRRVLLQWSNTFSSVGKRAARAAFPGPFL